MAATNLSIGVELVNNVSQPARKVNASIDGINKRMKAATLGTNQYGAAVNQSTRGLSKFAKSGLQQAGYQVGDFFVQVGAGTSALQAFGQQGSQLLGIFGPLGAILGAGVAIVAALGTAYQKSAGGASAFVDQAQRINDALSQQTVFGNRTKGALENLQKKYGELTPQVMSFFNAQQRIEELRIRQEIRSTNAALRSFSREVQDAEAFTKRMNLAIANGDIVQTAISQAMDLGKTSVKNLSDEYGVHITKVDDLRKAIDGVTAQGATADEKLQAITNVLEILGQRGSKATEKQDELREMLVALQEALVLVKGGVDDVNSALQEMGAYEPDNFMEAMAFHEQAIAKVDEAMKQQKATTEVLSKGIAQSFGDSFKSIITGTESVKDAFKNMARNIIDQLIEVLIIQRLVGTVGGNGQAGTGLAGVLSGTRAVGGPITTGQSYLVGEKGPEIITAGANARVIPNNQIGGGTTVVQNINISTGVSQTVRAEITQMLPQIQDAAKAAVIDARRRGGNFAGAFGG